MVSRFAKPQIGQTSSDSRMGLFTADLEDEISTDYTDYADYAAGVEQRDKPRQSDQAESKCCGNPKCQSQAFYWVVSGGTNDGLRIVARCLLSVRLT